MVQIIHASDVCSPQVLEGTPLLFTDSMKLYEEPNLFLRHQCFVSGSVRSFATYNTYADSLSDFLAFLEDNQLEDETESLDSESHLNKWKTVTADDLAVYRERMLVTVSPHTKRPYAEKTINGRISLVSLFYEWAFKEGKIDHNPVIYKAAKSTKQSSHKTSSKNRKDKKNALLITENKKLPKYFSSHELQLLRAVCDEEDNATGRRDKLIIDLLVSSGLRRMEALALTLDDWKLFRRTDATSKLYVFDASKTKGKVQRKIYIPQNIYDRVNQYIKIDRRKALQKGGKISRLKGEVFKASDQIFLNSEDSAWAGQPYALGRCSNRFKELCEKVGIPARGPHALRHTFAVNMYRLLIECGARNVWKTIQVLLGHKHMSTTIDVYLDSVSIKEADISDALAVFYDEHLAVEMEKDLG